MTITIHGAPLSPYVRKVRVVLAEKQLEYKIDPVSTFALGENKYPNLSRFLKAVLAHPSFAECVSHERKILAPLGLQYAL